MNYLVIITGAQVRDMPPSMRATYTSRCKPGFLGGGRHAGHRRPWERAAPVPSHSEQASSSLLPLLSEEVDAEVSEQEEDDVESDEPLLSLELLLLLLLLVEDPESLDRFIADPRVTADRRRRGRRPPRGAAILAMDGATRL